MNRIETLLPRYCYRKATNKARYNLVIAHRLESFEKEKANATNVFQKRVDLLIVSLSFDTKELEHFKQFEDKGIPVVYFDRVEEQIEGTKLIIDNYTCGGQATNHLIERVAKGLYW
jgi:LacI family transcriptional regulator